MIDETKEFLFSNRKEWYKSNPFWVINGDVNWHNSGGDLQPGFKYPIETFLNTARSLSSSVNKLIQKTQSPMGA